MENGDDGSFIEVSVGNQGSRKKKRRRESQNDSLRKATKYGPPSGMNVFVPCKHNNKAFKCCKVRPKDVIDFRNKLYRTCDKQQQDEFVSRSIAYSNVKRQRPRQAFRGLGLQQIKPKPHSFSATYKFTISSGEQVTVCKKFFLHLTKFKPDRVRQILKKLRCNKPFVECRGGDRVSLKSVLKKESVRKFIGGLRGKESHYNRNKSKRIYLQCDLSIKKLCNIYNSCTENPSLHVKIGMFRKIFCNEFNIGFRSPSSDVCSYCTLLDNKRKSATVEAEKQKLITEKRIHKLRSNCFYEILRKPAEDDEVKLCFDMQQVQPLPRTPIQQAFYSRQIGLYNVCIMDVSSQKPSFYIWTEDEAARGSTEVASALLSHMSTLDLSGKVRVSLFSDGCIGQNKNNHVLHSLMYFLAQNCSSVKVISLTFPVRGHSFLPADRVFGQAEKYLRQNPTIIDKAGYFEQYEKIGKVKKLGSEWELYDVKSLGNSLKNLPMISEKKRIILTKKILKNGAIKIEVQGHEFYRFEEDVTKYTLLKKGCKWINILNNPLKNIPLVHPISSPKKKDVAELLNILFGKEWTKDSNLEWYKKVCFEGVDGQPDEEQQECDCLENDCAIHL